MSKRVGALIAMNGDYYGARETGYVIRNGVLYRNKANPDNQEDLVIYEDGSMEIIKESEVTAEQLYQYGAMEVFSFGPGLIIDGKINVSVDQEVGAAKASNPRTAIGYIDKLHYVFVVSDGRTKNDKGLSLYELATFIQEYTGAGTVYNLDGGGSTTLVFNGQIINNPTSSGTKIAERSVSDIVYIGY